MAGDQSPRRPDDSGANVGWAAVGYLLAGIAVWGFLGSLVDRWLGLPKGIGVVVGMVLGAAGAIYLIVKRLGG
jgi:ATP synthase protein I